MGPSPGGAEVLCESVSVAAEDERNADEAPMPPEMLTGARARANLCLPTSQCHHRQLRTSFIIMSNNKAEGRREEALVKQRTQMREEFERQKQTLIQETEKARPSSNRFVGQNDSMEDTLKKSTVGLVRLEDFQQRRKELEEAKAREAARTNELKYVRHSYALACFAGACVWCRMTNRTWRGCLGMRRR